MGDDFRALKEYKKEQKDLRYVKNVESLRASGFDFQAKDPFESHFHVMTRAGDIVSFWPSSGAWRTHKQGTKTIYGFESLAAYLKKN